MAIKVGDKLPQATFRVMTADGPAAKTTDDLFKGRKVVLFAVPGAFTPTCHKNHLPGYVNKAAEIKGKGVEEIFVTGVNDVFVMDAWSKATGGAGVITFLSDGNADFAKEIGLSMDGSGVEDGVVTALNVEDAPGKADVSGAEAMLNQL
jgi:peroxiredoxin